MTTVTGVTGDQYTIGTQEYENMKYQYATSSYETENRMNPQPIIQLQNRNNIALTLKYAKSRRLPLPLGPEATSTAGHHLRPLPTSSWA